MLSKGALPFILSLAFLPAVVIGDCTGSQCLKNVVKTFTTPTTVTSTTVQYVVNEYYGVEIKPGEQWVFQIPPNFVEAVVRTVVLVHRKDSKYDASVEYHEDGTYYDTQGAYDAISCRKTGTSTWKGWGAAKFAEPRSSYDPEHENLHDWVYYVGIFSTDQILLENVSPLTNALSVANVHSVEIEFFPVGVIDSYQLEIFSPNTKFVDLAQGFLLPRYGGGPDAGLSFQQLEEDGLYPDAIELYYGTAQTISSTCYVDSSGRMHIKLPTGKTFGGFEVAIGDTKYNKAIPPQDQVNKDGGYGELGWAKLSARIGSDYFMSDINVPPNAVLSGGPSKLGYVTKTGDEVILSATSYAWVMGYRITFMKSGPTDGV